MENVISAEYIIVLLHQLGGIFVFPSPETDAYPCDVSFTALLSECGIFSLQSLPWNKHAAGEVCKKKNSKVSQSQSSKWQYKQITRREAAAGGWKL